MALPSTTMKTMLSESATFQTLTGAANAAAALAYITDATKVTDDGTKTVPRALTYMPDSWQLTNLATPNHAALTGPVANVQIHWQSSDTDLSVATQIHEIAREILENNDHLNLHRAEIRAPEPADEVYDDADVGGFWIGEIQFFNGF